MCVRSSLSFRAEVCGHEKLRHFWPRCLRGKDGLVFVLDALDRERLPEAREELESAPLPHPQGTLDSEEVDTSPLEPGGGSHGGGWVQMHVAF